MLALLLPGEDNGNSDGMGLTERSIMLGEDGGSMVVVVVAVALLVADGAVSRTEEMVHC